jgi:hypothetical protein
VRIDERVVLIISYLFSLDYGLSSCRPIPLNRDGPRVYSALSQVTVNLLANLAAARDATAVGVQANQQSRVATEARTRWRWRAGRMHATNTGMPGNRRRASLREISEPCFPVLKELDHRRKMPIQGFASLPCSPVNAFRKFAFGCTKTIKLTTPWDVLTISCALHF